MFKLTKRLGKWITVIIVGIIALFASALFETLLEAKDDETLF